MLLKSVLQWLDLEQSLLWQPVYDVECDFLSALAHALDIVGLSALGDA